MFGDDLWLVVLFGAFCKQLAIKIQSLGHLVGGKRRKDESGWTMVPPELRLAAPYPKAPDILHLATQV